MEVLAKSVTNKDLHQQRVRLNDILRRHVVEEDVALSDDQLVHAVVKRYVDARELHAIIDPAE
jgi:hypothetical protein